VSHRSSSIRRLAVVVVVLALAPALAACKDKSELVIGVATDLRARGQLDQVKLSARRDGVEVIANEWTLADARPERFELPGSFAIYSRGGNEPRVDLSVDGYKEGRLITTRPAKLSLVRGRTLFVRLTLVADCRQPDGPACPDGQACIEGACRPQEIEPRGLPEYRVDLVDKLPCASGTQYIVTTTGDPLPVEGGGCASDEVCQEGICMKRPDDEPAAPPADSGAWVAQSTPAEAAGAQLNAVWGTPTGSDVFAVGSRGTVLHQSGGSDAPWVPEALPAEDAGATLYAVAGAGAAVGGAAPDEVYVAGADAGGHGGVWHRAPMGPWVRERLPSTIERVSALWGRGGFWWAIGRTVDGATQLLGRDATTGEWRTDALLPPPPAGAGPTELRALAGLSPSDLVVAGPRGAVFRRALAGGAFTPIALPDGAAARELLSTFPVSPAELWLAGRGGLLARLLNGALTVEDVSLTSDLHAVWGSADNDVYVVGDLGQILHRVRTGAWRREASGTRRGLFAVWGSGPHNVYAVGRGGLILHSTGDPGDLDMAMPECTTPSQCPTTCANGVFTGAACNATRCEPLAAATCAGGFACADATRCRTDCAVDADCQSDRYCAADRTCQPRKAQGALCNDAAGADCLGGTCRVCGDGLFCTDGVCCDKSPAQCGGCERCTAPTGTCGPVPAGEDPHNTCPASGDECQLTACNGTGACGKPNGTPCGTPMCAAATLTTKSCTGGVCTTNAPAPCPGGSSCNAMGTGCNATCASDSDCTSNYFCDSTGACRARVAQGGTCNPPVECRTSGCRICQGTLACADGRCCDRACTGTCEACDTAAAPGTCTTLTSGQPRPGHGACTNGGAVPCGGSCAGNPTQCTNPTVSCRTAQCVTTSNNYTLRQPASCSGGSCPAQVTTSCFPYACNVATSACNAQCNADSDCAVDGPPRSYVCDTVAHQCKKANGQQCGAPGECASGNCIDGVCCNVACNGVCQACDVGGSVGTCTTLTGGQPRAGHGSCGGTGQCAGSCGGNPVACSYPTTTTCAAATCSSPTTARLAAQCTTSGTCPAQATQNCFPFACSGGACKTSCTSNADCATGYACDTTTTVNRQCKLANGQSCGTNGAVCASGICADGVCCNATCGGVCQACNLGGSVGTCTTATSGGPLHGACGGSASCSGSCGGNPTACSFSTSQVCTAASCSSANNYTANLAASCAANGSCPAQTQQDCRPFSCGGGACKSTCSTNADCAVDPVYGQLQCTGGQCRRGNGQQCTAAAQCASGNCVDGYCCNSACGGQCEACDITPGTCTTVNLTNTPTGKPHGTTRPDCTNRGTTCGGVCDGKSNVQCTYASSNTQCVAQSCVPHSPRSYQLQGSATCNGEGTCGTVVPGACGSGLACDTTSNTCFSSCVVPGLGPSSARCAPGSACVNISQIAVIYACQSLYGKPCQTDANCDVFKCNPVVGAGSFCGCPTTCTRTCASATTINDVSCNNPEAKCVGAAISCQQFNGKTTCVPTGGPDGGATCQ